MATKPAPKNPSPKPTAPEPKPTVPSHPTPAPVAASLPVAVEAAYNEVDVLRARVAELTAFAEKVVKTATLDFAAAHVLLRR